MTKKYGIIGCGMMGHEHIANLNLLEGAEVSVVYDPIKDLAEAASRKAGGAEIARSVEVLATTAGLDAVVIVSPNHNHIDNLEEISAFKDLPILCEKPFYSHPEQEGRLDQFLTKHKSPVWVAMEYRYMPPIQKFIEQANDVTGGIKMLTIKEHRFPFLPKIGNWNRFNHNSGGTLVEKCCHFFDLMRLILQSEPIRVTASAGQMVNHLDEVYDGQTSDISYVCLRMVRNGMKKLAPLVTKAKLNVASRARNASGQKISAHRHIHNYRPFHAVPNAPKHKIF